MTEKDFKQMIKNHEVKQTFVIPEFFTCVPYVVKMSKIYINTITGSMYKVEVKYVLAIDESKVYTHIYEIDKQTYDTLWQQYKDTCLYIRKEKYNIIKTYSNLETCKSLKRYYNEFIKAVNFIVKDKRI